MQFRLTAKKRRRYKKIRAIFLITLLLAAIITLVIYEVRTSRLQAALLPNIAQSLSWTLNQGSNPHVRYPVSGPFDRRMGYVDLPVFLQRLQQRNFIIDQQTRFSPELESYTAQGLFPPYQEKSQAGLTIQDCHGEEVYSYRYPRRGYADFSSIPPLVVNALLFIENRELLSETYPQINPAVDWTRFTRAAVMQLSKAIGLDYTSMGGSTLATQIEKYRHSEDGITSSIEDKLKQMASASIRVYRQGEQTLAARQQLVVSYLNTVPLAAAPGQGEVNGLGDGLWAWMGADFDETNQALNGPEGDPTLLQKKATALRQVIALMIAHRRPTYYLIQGREELNRLTSSYLRLMYKSGYISQSLMLAAVSQPNQWRKGRIVTARQLQETGKAAVISRNRLSELLQRPLYELDRTDLSVAMTFQLPMQETATEYLHDLNNKEFARRQKLLGYHLLTAEQAPYINYSFTLFERTQAGNRVRIQTDNTNQPFDINESSKLELGSTAKLRVLATYLEIIQELHQRYASLTTHELRALLPEAQDDLTQWALNYLLHNRHDLSLSVMLQAALERRYSANPEEVFFTGGGLHSFSNFQHKEDSLTPTVRESLQNSINLPFVRIMRDLVNYSLFNSVDGTRQLLQSRQDPRRKDYLARFADREGLVYLQRFWRSFQNKSTEAQVDDFLEGLRQNASRLSAVHRYLYPHASRYEFAAFLSDRLPDEDLSDTQLDRLYQKYAQGKFTLTDQSYIAGVHPLELWLLGYRVQHPQASYQDAVSASEQARQEVYGWLFSSRTKNAQDSRIRIMLEVEAFSDLHQRWVRLGYPFDHLVPSLGTALGSSGDRPAALAELMGIILNDGIRAPTVRIEQLRFAEATPYETALSRHTLEGARVMHAEVAKALRAALSGVVQDGTAERIKGAFVFEDGRPMPIGGKTGTGDNRIVTLSPSGQRIKSRAVNRTATFVFYLGENYFGTLTAYVTGNDSATFKFTSALPVQALKGLAPLLLPWLTPQREPYCKDTRAPGLDQPDET
ncbi:MAG: penicillin-binding protein [Hahellaceae bacterium]|nr:penicillin-binding protein [Hahellaceae bacterium]MCP5169746.1 penicillin-binding protein [Hahellaceae bacterium]